MILQLDQFMLLAEVPGVARGIKKNKFLKKKKLIGYKYIKYI